MTAYWVGHTYLGVQGVRKFFGPYFLMNTANKIYILEVLPVLCSPICERTLLYLKFPRHYPACPSDRSNATTKAETQWNAQNVWKMAHSYEIHFVFLPVCALVTDRDCRCFWNSFPAFVIARCPFFELYGCYFYVCCNINNESKHPSGEERVFLLANIRLWWTANKELAHLCCSLLILYRAFSLTGAWC